jgi:hypothetical protein
MGDTELITVRLLFLIAQKLGVSKSELVNLVHQACRDEEDEDVAVRLVNLLR